MNKLNVINYIGNGSQLVTSERLGYKSIQSVYNWPEVLGKGRMDAIILRMRAYKIPVPKDWL